MWNWVYEFFKKNMSFDLVITCIIVLIILYFLCTTEKKTYEFQGLGEVKVTQEYIAARPRKESKRKHKMEEKCRAIFEDIFKRMFNSVRPDFLKNPVTKKNLELDGFCPDIYTPIGKGIAFEYDGVQHAKFSPHFHKEEQDFIYQTKKDSFKDRRCKERGILLIRIPHYVIEADLEKFIKQKLRNKGMKV